MRILIALTLSTTLSVLPATAQDFSEEQIKELALQAILENPQIVMDAVAILQERDAAKAEAQAQATLGNNRDTLERDPNAPVIGNPDGDVTVVEFFDYNCPYCKRAADEVAKVLDTDKEVRIVYREWPILGEGSVFAARAALAARAQGKYPEMHKALMSMRGRVNERSTLQAAAELGLDIDQLRADMEDPAVQEHIDTTMRLASSLGFSGTPSFVIGEARAPGLIDAEQMQQMIDDVREGG
ncbi:MAG: DsbA family protein [Jannaschia helgolandensis]|jgi:protein-disulfide isomerase|uniref:Protein-disulfide isomerase n=1 Tax=Jannaschia helgolandensis TaxID=188906 RepID=A0A1H7FKS0_9RHOB|nr:DsbA family protein [Jannaschia helgolandensis]SEK25042.1 Protein-disulfide isomerase [Jannaschia helgolandensis]|tara:strand:+ start:1329 stop:2051 length:723 start_codon:yes stop_codon:yes gene_type:complete